MLRVCPTPIGNLGDITLRTLEALRNADIIAAEDTRHTRKLLSHHGISKPMVSFHEHNELSRLPELLAKLRDGKELALVSDAGMPGICDPGYRLIAAAIDEGLPVEVLPGPSALDTALVASGFPTDSFAFIGYLPRRKGELEKVLATINSESRTCVAYESPHRLAKTLAAAAPILKDRRIAICRELTKKFEEITRGTATELFANLPEKVKGEIVLVFEGAGTAEKIAQEDGSAEQALAGLLEEGVSSRRAAELISIATGISRNNLYKKALELKGM
ncbi:MAG: 16S rRNA (cytidine(1402)-2'-O)-methyltransferase [Thermoleophilia bacterium]|nr:16S rRNA (cytidine(1402)-2'-O)-methyltransferase [Thermoleophilia bacterium]